ncbi:MAG TPA: hypothetical protein VF608_14515, partial [Thermoanaerobaculia bacterium]
MRDRALALFAILAIATPMFAVTFGDIDITTRKEFGPPQLGFYFEQRFHIANRSRDSHAVRITLEGTANRGGEDRASRTFQIPGKSETIVAVPVLVTGYYTPSEAIIAIDGSVQSDRVQLSQLSSWEQQSNPNVLVSRSVQHPNVTTVDIVRPDVAPSEWSSSWLQYDRFDAIIVTSADWNELPPPVQNAIHRWTFAGGTLVFSDPPDPMPVVSVRSTDGRYGLGRIIVFPDGKVEVEQIKPSLQWRTRDDAVHVSAVNELPLLDEDRLPVRGLFGVLLIFAVVGGPVNLFLLAKKNRRLWIFGSIPLLAIATSFLLVGATIASEGWVRIERSLSITFLDESLGQAATLGWSGYYATVSPRGAVRFAPDTELRTTVGRGNRNADTTWDDGQRLFGSWVGTRVPTYFVVRKSEQRRERLPLRVDGKGLAGVNGLGSHIEHVWAANMNGEIFEAKNVEPGKAFTLAPSREFPKIGTPLYDPERMMHLDTWVLLLQNARKDPSRMLLPGTYVAELRDSPF